MRQSSSGGIGSIFGDDWLIRASLIGLLGLVALGPVMSGTDNPFSGEGNPARQGGYIAVMLLALIGIQPWRNPRAILSLPINVAAALAICAVSLAWSISPDVGVRRLFLTVVIVWTIFTTVRELGYREALGVIRIGFAILLFVNYLTVFTFPQIGIHQFGVRYEMNLGGDWRGIMMHKNFAGAVCAVTALLFLFDARNLPPVVRAGIIAASVVFVYYSQSKTSFGMLVGTAIAGSIFAWTQFRMRSVIVAVVALAFLGLMAYLNVYVYTFEQAANDPNTLTGRVMIWRTLFNYISDHFWLGSGYGSFWNIGPTSPIYQYSSDWVRTLAAGHNGYIDLACQIGVPLAVVTVALIFLWPFVQMLIGKQVPQAGGALTLSLLLFCAGHNFTESTLLERDAPNEAILMLTLALLARLLAKPKPRGAGRAGGRSDFVGSIFS